MRVIFGIILVVALGVRLHELTGQSIWFDEACTIRIAKLPLTEVLPAIAYAENTPPLHYLILWPWVRMFGDSPASVRMPSVLFGVGAVWALHHLCVRLFDRPAALLAAAMLAVSPYHIFYSQEARAYALMVLLGLLSCVWFIRWLDRPTRTNAAGWTIVSILLLYTHLYCGGMILAQCAVLFALIPRLPYARERLSWWFTMLAFVSLAFAPFVPTALQWSRRAPTFWIKSNSYDDVSATLIDFGGSLPLALVLSAASILAVCRRRDFGVALLSMVFVCCVMLPVAASVLTHPLYLPRYGIIASVCLFALASAGGTSFVRSDFRRSRAVTAAASVVLIAAMALGSPPPARRDFRPVAAYLDARLKSDDYVVIQPRLDTILFRYHVRRTDLKLKGLDYRAIPLSLPLPGEQRVWLVSGDAGIGEIISRGPWTVLSQAIFDGVMVIELRSP